MKPITILLLLFITTQILANKASDKLIRQGDEAVIKKDYDEAIKHYSSALSADSECVRAYYKRANVYYMMMNYRKALYDINLVLNVDPDYYKVRFVCLLILGF